MPCDWMYSGRKVWCSHNPMWVEIVQTNFGFESACSLQESNNKMLTIKRTACLTHVDDQEDHAGLVGVGTVEWENHEHGPRRVDWVSACRKTHMESMMHSKVSMDLLAWDLNFFSLLWENHWCDFENSFLYLYNLWVPEIKLGLV